MIAQDGNLGKIFLKTPVENSEEIPALLCTSGGKIISWMKCVAPDDEIINGT